MHFKELVKSRYSVRSYHDNKVDRTLLKEVVNAGRLAPSAANRQPWRFVVVDEDTVLDKIKQAYPRDWFEKVPGVIIVYGNHNESWKRSFDNKDHCDIDIAIAVDHMTLMATELGLGTCWVCHFDSAIINDAIKNDEGLEPIVILAIGYPLDVKVPEKFRKNLDEVIRFNSL